jgi:hypothetical protein
MEDRQTTRLTDTELYALFDRLFPDGLASPDVMTEIASQGWERSPLLACFHPSVERVFEERLQMHRNLERLFPKVRQRRADAKSPPPEPTLDAVRREYQPSPVNQQEEVTELVGMCLWDVFSDNHDVIAPDGRQADIGSFRGASAFLDDYLTRGQDSVRSDYMRFYMGTAFLSGRADLTPVYVMIFRRLEAIGADWIYHFPELGVVDLAPLREQLNQSGGTYSVTEGAVAELRASEHRAEVQRLRAELDYMNAQAREEALDRPTPATVRAYREVYGSNPRGWPPA